MNNPLFNPDIVPLIQGLKPFLPDNAQYYADGVLRLIDLATSESAQEAAQNLSRMFLLPDNKSITIQTAAGPLTLSLDSAFLLFLILILLILSGNLLTFDTGASTAPSV